MFRIEREIGMSQVGRDGRLSLRGAHDFMIDCCQFQIPTLTQVAAFFRDLNLGLFVIYRQSDIIRRPEYGEKVSITTSIFDCRNFYGYRNTMIRDAQENVCVACFAMGAFVNLSTGKPEKLPTDVIASLNYDPRMDMEYTARKIAIPQDIHWDFAMHRNVSENQIDLNGHLNSNWYLSFTEELLPSGFSYDRVRIEYKEQAKSGAPLRIGIAQTAPGTQAFRIDDGGNTLHALLEFSSR